MKKLLYRWTCPVSTSISILWPESLLEALGRRAAAPRLRRSGAGWVLELAGEPPAMLDVADHDPAARSVLLERDGI